MIGDTAALAIAGNSTTAGLLSFLEGFQNEENYLYATSANSSPSSTDPATNFSSVWSQVVSSLANVRSIFADNEAIAKGLQEFRLRLLTPAAEKIGWDFGPNEDFLQIQLRALLLSSAGGVGHKE